MRRSGSWCGIAVAFLAAGCADLSSPATHGTALIATDGADSPDAKAASSCAADALHGGDAAAFTDAFVDPQYAVAQRQPDLGSAVCQPVDHWWTFASTGVPPSLKLGFGTRHDAGDLPGAKYTYSTADQHTFHIAPTITWPGPGHHVHLVAFDAAGKTILDPFFEYDVVVGK